MPHEIQREVTRLRAEIKKGRDQVEKDTYLLAVRIATQFVEIAKSVEIACEPDERRTAENAKRQIIAAMKEAESSLRERIS